MYKHYHSYEMYEYTEKPGQLLPRDSHQIIRHRYDVARSLVDGKRLLELGAGHGVGIEYLKSRAHTYVGGEYSKENIDFISKEFVDTLIVRLDANQLPFAKGSFDIVVALAMIYYLDFDCFADQVRKILAPAGVLFFCISNKDVPGFVSAPHTTAYYSIPEIAEKLSNKGFNCNFYGSFPRRYRKTLLRDRFYFQIRDFSKKIINKIPFGRIAWKLLRNHMLGGAMELPRSVEDINLDEEWKKNYTPLSSKSIDRNYRVIYCIAQMKEV